MVASAAARGPRAQTPPGGSAGGVATTTTPWNLRACDRVRKNLHRYVCDQGRVHARRMRAGRGPQRPSAAAVDIGASIHFRVLGPAPSALRWRSLRMANGRPALVVDSRYYFGCPTRCAGDAADRIDAG